MKSNHPHTRSALNVTRALLLCLGALMLKPLPTLGQHIETWSPWRISESEIHSTGAVRFSEVLRMMPAVETWSSDRYTLRFLGTGTAGQHPGGPGIVLDGVALPSFFLDRVLTESLPVAPGELSGLSWQPGQQMMSSGRLAEGSLVLNTPMRTGWFISGAMAVINETGDPGPAKHTDAQRNNVDRSGPATWMRAGWGNGQWMVQAGLQTDLHHLTDDRISGRVRRTYAKVAQPVITQFAPFVRLRFEGDRWTGHLLTGHSRRKDFIFHEGAGWEWPARMNRSWMAGRLAGQFEGIRVSIDTDASLIDLSDRPTFIDLPPGIVLEEASAEASLEVDWAGVTWLAGLGARTSGISQDDLVLRRFMPTAKGGLEWEAGSWGSRLAGYVLQIPAAAGRSAALSRLLEWSLSHRGDSGGLELDTRFSRGHFPESGQLAEWAVAGLDLGDWMTLSTLSNAEDVPQALGFGLTGFRFLSKEWRAWAEGRVRWSGGQVMPDRVIDQPFGIGPLLPSWTWSSPHSGWLFSRALGLERTPVDGIAWRAFLQFHHVSSEGDDVFFRHQTGFPRHRFWIMASEERSGGFSWMTRIGYVSAWTWPEYHEPARRSIPADIIVDATIGKSLFSSHVRALVSLLNLPNRALGNHPAGVEEQLAIRLTLSFSSVSERMRP